jgi:5-formyltetrahydrofolate cyclo-ligase
MKNALRKKYKSLRKSITPEQKIDFDLSIYNNLSGDFNLENLNVSVFLPIENFTEVNTWHFIDNIKANYFLPVVQSKILKHIKYENKAQLVLSDWGILEPTCGEETTPDQFDFVIVPLLTFDNSGNRIGYGAGFYDEFLKDCKPTCKIIGVSYFDPTNDLIETYPTDIPLHYCVTPTKVYKF